MIEIEFSWNVSNKRLTRLKEVRKRTKPVVASVYERDEILLVADSNTFAIRRPAYVYVLAYLSFSNKQKIMACWDLWITVNWFLLTRRLDRLDRLGSPAIVQANSLVATRSHQKIRMTRVPAQLVQLIGVAFERTLFDLSVKTQQPIEIIKILQCDDNETKKRKNTDEFFAIFKRENLNSLVGRARSETFAIDVPAHRVNFRVVRRERFDSGVLERLLKLNQLVYTR